MEIKLKQAQSKKNFTKLFKKTNQTTIKSKLFVQFKYNFPSILEELHASFGLQIGLNPEELIAASNNIKNLLKQDPDNIENLKLFYNFQTCFIKQLRKIDEDLNLFNIVSNIIDIEPENPYFLSEKAWLMISNQNLYCSRSLFCNL